MAEAIRETLCTSCHHRDVCAHKENYLEMVKSLEETFNSFPEGEREHMKLVDPTCNHYMMKNISMINIKQAEGGGLSPSEISKQTGKHTPKAVNVNIT